MFGRMVCHLALTRMNGDNVCQQDIAHSKVASIVTVSGLQLMASRCGRHTEAKKKKEELDATHICTFGLFGVLCESRLLLLQQPQVT